jgi:hypothetical protein
MRTEHDPTDRRDATAALLPDRRPSGSRRARRSGSSAFVVIGVAVLLTACSSSSTPSTTTTTRGTPTTTAPTTTTSAPTTTTSGPKVTGCKTSSLAITFGSPNGTAGAIHYGIIFHNFGSSTCTLYGYPGVSFLGAGGSQIGAPAQREDNLTPATVTLTPGGNAYTSVAVTDPGIPPCSSSATATQVRIYPPGETHAALVGDPAGVSVCSSPNTANYRSAIVAPVTASSV